MMSKQAYTYSRNVIERRVYEHLKAYLTRFRLCRKVFFCEDEGFKMLKMLMKILKGYVLQPLTIKLNYYSNMVTNFTIVLINM